jgi:hypothetical protein
MSARRRPARGTPLLRKELFTQVTFDSGALSPLTQVVHQLKDPGQYRGTVLLKEQEIGQFAISVGRDVAAGQVGLDLSAFAAPGKLRFTEYALREGGYVLLHVSRGSGYAAMLAAMDEEVGFDSRRLDEGDVFAATILRPGAYSLTNEHAKARGRLRVAYPEVQKERYVPPPPLRIACLQGQFDPQEVELAPAQGAVFECRTPSRLVIELQEPDDGPEGKRGPRRPHRERQS